MKKNIHVLHVISGDLWGGAESQLLTLARAQDKWDSIQVSVFILNSGRLEQELVDSGIRVKLQKEDELSSLAILRRLVATIREFSPDVVHTHRAKENVLGSIAAYICNRIPCLRTVHGALEHKPAWYQIHKRVFMVADWFCGRFLQRSIVAVSDDLSVQLDRQFGTKVMTILNGIDIGQTLKEAGPPISDPAFVGMVGRLVPVKRVDLVIRAAEILIRSGPKDLPRFLIFGDGPLRDELEILSARLGVTSIVEFRGHCDNVLHEMRSLRAIVLTSDHEGLPMTLLEAMVLKIPIIAHAVGGIPHLLNYGECGLLLTETEPNIVGKAIIDLLNPENAPERSRQVAAAYERVTNVFAAETAATSYDSLYRKISTEK